MLLTASFELVKLSVSLNRLIINIELVKWDEVSSLTYIIKSYYRSPSTIELTVRIS